LLDGFIGLIIAGIADSPIRRRLINDVSWFVPGAAWGGSAIISGPAQGFSTLL